MLGFGPIAAGPIGAIPDSYIVEIDPEASDLVDVKRQLAEIRDLIRDQNTNLSEVEAAVAIAEVGELERSLAQPRVRLKVLMEHARATLQWVADKSAGGALAALAATALKMLAAHFGISLP
jgi:hypothetical protein